MEKDNLTIAHMKFQKVEQESSWSTSGKHVHCRAQQRIQQPGTLCAGETAILVC